MKPYHKIQTIYKRDPGNNFKTLLDGIYATPEFEYLKDNEWVFTEKIHGTNIRVQYNPPVMCFQGKTDKAEIPSFLLDKLKTRFPEILMKEAFPEEKFSETRVCLYGEGFGAKIQKGGGDYISNGVDFILFDVKVGDWWLKREAVVEIAEKIDIPIVPVIGRGTLDDMIAMIHNGQFFSQWGAFRAEGIVARPAVELFDRAGRRIITKIKGKDFPDIA